MRAQRQLGLKLLGSLFGTLALTLALTACVPPANSPNLPSRNTQCPPELSQEASFSAVLIRPLAGGGNGLVVINAAITIAAVTADPDFEGVVFSDMVVSKVVRVLERQLPYNGRGCMPPDKPVAWLFRATLTELPDQAYDNLQCRIESGGVIAQALTIRRVETTDFIKGADAVQVQCLWTYVPDGYSGPIPEPPLGHS